MKLDLVNKKILMTEKECELAGRIGSDEYKNYLELQEKHPLFDVKTVKIKRTNKQPFKRMTIQMMLDYIKAHGNKEILTKFYKLRGKDENGKDIPFATVHTVSEIKIWFFETFPEIQNPNEEANDLLEKAKRKRQERLQAKILR